MRNFSFLVMIHERREFVPLVTRIQTFSSDHGIDEIGGLGKVHVDRVVLEVDGGDAEESNYCT